MKKENPEAKNKVRRKKVSSSRPTSKKSSTSKKVALPSERKTNEKKRTTSSSSSSKNPRTRPTSSSKSTTRRKKVSTKARTGSKALKRKRRSRKRKKIIAGFIAVLIVGFALCLGFVFASLKDVKPVNESILNKLTYRTTTIKYANGETMSNAPTLYKKKPVPLSDISPFLRKAIVSIEDERYYSHSGVDYWGLTRSVVRTLQGKRQGGSTIPMQVSKTLLTSSDQTMSRKVKDIYYALEMSKSVSKDKILETYLNNYFVGRGMCGAEAGANGYFNKHASELTLSEAAILAGVTRNPTRYAPYKTGRLTGNETKGDINHKLLFFIPNGVFKPANAVEKEMFEKLHEWDLVDTDTYKQLKSGDLILRKAVSNPDAEERKDTVLRKMRDLGEISDAQYAEAKSEPINVQFSDATRSRLADSVESLIEYDVIDALMEQGKTEEEARNMYYNGGLIVNSTIDPKIQKAIDDQYNNNNNFPKHMIAANGLSQPQSATVILDYKTGNIKGMIGGRNIKARKTLNRAITPYQPGSTIKPLSVYTPAIDTLKVTQSTLVSDARGGYKFKENQKDNPETTTKGYGSMCLRHGMALSSNTIAYKTAEMLGPTYDDCMDVMIDYLRNFGITTILDFKEQNKAGMQSSDRHFNSLVLGGLTKGISPLQMSAAFGTLANGGIYVEPEIFTTITTYNGELLVKNTPQTHKVVDPEVAYVMVDMLKAVITEGIGKNAALPRGMPTAGKTGSTNSYLDTWFVGFTPYYSGATYIGDDAGVRNEDGTIMKRRRIEGGGSMSSSKLWGKIMKTVHQNLEVKDFDRPDGVYMIKINPLDGGKTAYGVMAAFVDGTYPTRYSSVGYYRPKPKKKTTTSYSRGYNRGYNRGTGTTTGTGTATGAGTGAATGSGTGTRTGTGTGTQ